MPHATHPSPGLQAFILCGPGVSLNTFTSSPKDFPKALIPIANRPMVWYPLDWCYRMGVNDITLITPAESSASLAAALNTNPALTSLPSPKPEILSPTGLTQTTGTGELLRLPEVQKRITSDFVILPCDLVSELDGSKLVQQWITINPLLESSSAGLRKGGLGIYYPTQGLEGISSKKDETDFVASVPLPTAAVPPSKESLRSEIEEVVLSMPTDTLKDLLEEDKDSSLKIRHTLITKHGRVKIKTKHRDSHVYVFPHWVKDFVAKNAKFESIAEDVLGWWTKAGWQDGLAEKLGLNEVLLQTISQHHNEDDEALDEEIDISALSSTKSQPVPSTDPARPAFASRVGVSIPQSDQTVNLPPFLAYIQPSLPAATTSPGASNPIIRRVDTTAALLNISLYLAKKTAPDHTLAHEHHIHPTAKVGLQSRVSQEDSLVGENVTLGTRVNVKESVIGANCEIGNNVRLTRCLLMDGVVVGDGVQMSGCIIGRRARVEGTKPEAPPAAVTTEGGETMPAPKPKKKKGGDDDEDKTKLTDCEVAPGFVVEAGTVGKGEKLMAFDTGAGMDGFDDDDDEVEDDVDDDI